MQGLRLSTPNLRSNDEDLLLGTPELEGVLGPVRSP